MDPGVAFRVIYIHWSCACIIHLLSSNANNGFPKPSSMPAPDGTKRGTKRGTATEHAKQPAHWKCKFQTQLNRNHMAEAQADRAVHTLEQLVFKLADFCYSCAARAMLLRLLPKLR